MLNNLCQSNDGKNIDTNQILEKWSKHVLLDLRKRYDLLCNAVRERHPEYTSEQTSETAFNVLRIHFYDFKTVYDTVVTNDEIDGWCTRYCKKYSKCDAFEDLEETYGKESESYKYWKGEKWKCVNKTRRDRIRRRHFAKRKKRKEDKNSKDFEQKIDHWFSVQREITSTENRSKENGF